MKNIQHLSWKENKYFLMVAVLIFAQLPQIILGYINSDGSVSWIPVELTTQEFWILLSFLLSTLVFILMHTWYGLISAGFFFIWCMVSGFANFSEGATLWGVLQIGTSALGLIFLIGAVKEKIILDKKNKKLRKKEQHG